MNKPAHLTLAGLISDKVLANFDFYMGQMALLAVNRNRIVRCISHPVRLVVADLETLLAAQQLDQYMGETRIAIVEHADMPGAADAVEYGRETVHRDQRCRPAGLSPPIQFARNPVVIGLKYLSNAGLDIGFAESDISGNGGEFAHLDDRGL